MKSGYVKGINIPNFDSEITEFLNKKEISGDFGNMVTAIQNEDKKVYRIILTEGLGEYMQIVSFLTGLDLIDQLENSMEGKNGFDSFFTVPKKN